MAKFTIILAALFVTLFALAEATTYTTITTTTIIEEENPKQSKCQEQIQQQQQLSHCRMYLSPQSRSPYSRMAIMNAQEEHLQDCCQQLQQLEAQCVCKAIQQIVSQQPQGQQQQGQQQMEQMVQDAQNLPRKCNIQLSQRCQIQAGSVSL